VNNLHQQQEIQTKHDDYADKPMLLGEGRENEIRMRNRKEAKLRLGAAGHAPSPDASVSHGNFRLNHLVAGAARIPGRIQKGDQSRLLVILQEMPADWKSQSARQHNRRQLLPSKSCQ